jgi:branched-chain amino acid transport system ATP-binding protein
VSAEFALHEVRAGYGRVEVLHGISLAFPRGALTALLGPNGAGKTTTLHVISGLVEISAGRLEWDGQPAAHLSTFERARAGMLLVPERRGVFFDLSVRDNLEIFAAGHDEQGRFDAALDAFPVLGERLGQRAGTLSGGEQQMLAMSRALLRRPRLLLLDEISLGLAPRVTANLFEVVAEIARSRTTVVLVEQYLAQALRLADVVYVLSRGEVAFAGEPGELAGGKLPGYPATAQLAG